MNKPATKRAAALGILLAVVLAAPAGSSPAVAQDSVLFSETFEGELQNGWRWVRAQRRGWNIDNGELRVRTRPGSIYADGNGSRNILLRELPEVDDPVLVEVSVVVAPERLHENAGLLLYVDDDNYVTVDLGAHGPGQSLRAQVYGESGGAPSTPEYAAYDGESIYLAMRVTDSDVTGMYRRLNTDAWQPLGTVPRPRGGRERVGVKTDNGVANTERWARFDNFRISRDE